MWVVAAATALLLALSFVAWMLTLIHWFPHPRDGGAAQADMARPCDVIRAELAGSNGGPDGAGMYLRPMGRNADMLAIAPRSGFVTESVGCTDFYSNCGDVAERGGTLELTFRFPDETDRSSAVGSSLLPVAWDQRVYLVSVDRLDDFASDVNLGHFEDVAADSRYFVRGPTHAERPSVPPSLPPEHARHLLPHAVSGSVVDVRPSATDEPRDHSAVAYDLVLDHGSDDGLWVGMRVSVAASPDLEEPRVVALNAHTAHAITRAHGEHRVPHAGAGWSTRAAE